MPLSTPYNRWSSSGARKAELHASTTVGCRPGDSITYNSDVASIPPKFVTTNEFH